LVLKTYLQIAGTWLLTVSLFMKIDGGVVIYVLVYVDDIIVIGFSSIAVAALLHGLNQFVLKDLGDLRF
jgi:hypothetical protein